MNKNKNNNKNNNKNKNQNKNQNNNKKKNKNKNNNNNKKKNKNKKIGSPIFEFPVFHLFLDEVREITAGLGHGDLQTFSANAPDLARADDGQPADRAN